MKITYDDSSVTVSQLNPTQVEKLLDVINIFIEDQFKIAHKPKQEPKPHIRGWYEGDDYC